MWYKLWSSSLIFWSVIKTVNILKPNLPYIENPWKGITPKKDKKKKKKGFFSINIPTDLLGKLQRIKNENRKVCYFCFNSVHDCQKDLVMVANKKKIYIYAF